MEQNSLAAALCMTTLAGLSTGLGGLLVLWRLPGKKLLARSLGFAAGVMLAVSLGDLTPIGMEYFSTRLPPAAAGAAAAGLLLTGMLTGAAMDGILPEEKVLWNSIAGQDADDRRRALHCGVVVGLALVAHNLPEGILTLFSGVQDPREGLRLSLAIALHNLPEGISTAAPIWYATHSRKKSVLAAFGSGLAEPLGALLAYFVLSPVLSPGLLAGLTLGAAGVMCWVSVSELLFGGFALGRRGDTAAGFAAGVCGMILGIAVLA